MVEDAVLRWRGSDALLSAARREEEAVLSIIRFLF